MISPTSFSFDAMQVAVGSAAFAEGGLMVALASLVHEEYGTELFGVLYGTFLTFGAVGLYALDEIFFPNIFAWYGEENASGVQYFMKYGEWNAFLFKCITGAYFVVLLLAIVSHISIKRREAADSQVLVMVKF